MALNERQKLFCKQYIACRFNASQAAIKAGYSEDTAGAIGHENLKKPDIQEYISELIGKTERRVGIDTSIERTLLEIGRIAFADDRAFYNEDGSLKSITELDDDAAASIAGYEVEEKEGKKKGRVKKVRRWDKTKALELLAKINKMFSDAPVVQNEIKPLSDNQVDKILNAIRESRQSTGG